MTRMLASMRRPQEGISKEFLGIFRERFVGLDPATLAAAVEYAIEHDDFFPTIRRFREIVATVDVALGHRLDGAAAWEAFARRVLRPYSPGITKSFDWPDDLTRSIVREQLGGVHYIANVEKEYTLGKVRERFIEAYDAAGAVAEAQRRAQIAGGNLPRLAARGE